MRNTEKKIVANSKLPVTTSDYKKINEKAAIQVLKDHIIWTRMSELIYKIQNIYNPSKNLPTEFEAEDHYEGYGTALLLLNITANSDLCCEIGDITYELILNSEENAKDLAEKIYVEWLVTIKNFYTSRREAVTS